MIISPSISLRRIIGSTYKHFIYNVIICILSYIVYRFFLKDLFSFPSIIPTILGTALSFSIGFNNNQAYSRWWEARIVWGALVNESRTWARQVIKYVPEEKNAAEAFNYKSKMVYRHIAFIYALKTALRGHDDGAYMQFLSKEEASTVNQSFNKHNAILTNQSEDLNKLYKDGFIDGFKFMEMNKSLTEFSNEMGKSERIKNTVFPTTYSYYSKLFIWFLIVSVTMVTSDSIGIYSILFGVVIGYVFLTIHLIGQLLLDPFIPIPTCIPLDQISRTIEINLKEMLAEDRLPDPIVSTNKEYVM